MLNTKTKNLMFFLICWLTYVSSYLCRVNLSSVFYKLESEFQSNSTFLGVLGTLFFFTYAFGQLINGYIGDHVSPYKFITFAVFGTAVLNFVIPTTSSIYILMVCWGLNGIFQSMLWGPLIRVLSFHFPQEQRVNVVSGMSSSIIAGFILSWTVLGNLFIDLSWKYYFYVPSVCAFIMFFLWLMISRNKRYIQVKENHRGVPFKEALHTIITEKLWIVALMCICIGLIKENLALLTPLFLTKALGISAKQSVFYVMMTPIANLCGIFLSRYLIKLYGKSIKNIILILLVSLAACSFSLYYANSNPIAVVILFPAIAALSYGCSFIFISFIPISFADKNIVSTLIGIFDFSSYIGAALSSTAFGYILSSSKWNTIPLIWGIIAILGLLLSINFQRKVNRADNCISC